MNLKRLGRLVRHDLFALIVVVGSIGRSVPSVQHTLGFISPATVMPEFCFIGPGLVVLELYPSCWHFCFIDLSYSG